ncbi:MBL fold metallo-hydrolase [Ketobacter sp.]|uniref:MBL fold metallo-hydrolase n=1 Tax=Ketobacter sp. TaxID=2083498 RepID=UPI000F1D07D6|nr:MBL fold metallo-hydrolase [Ketobacter sp.]RLU01487.1 MAG: MBL fold metallo-hydrolase [Ketobacter sp.]
MRFASIGSGSDGNGTLIQGQDQATVLVDCGFSAREALARMGEQGVVAEDLAAILVTHEHGDHIKGVARLANLCRIPVYCTWGTWASKLNGVLDDALFRLITPHEGFSVAGLMVQPVPVPHDAREPCQFVLEQGGRRLGLLSDVGSVTPHMVESYQGCDALMLECNHDLAMLAEGPYPPSLKRRVSGPLGHLNNRQSADMLSQLERSGLQHLVVAHISQKNNHPDLALEALLGDALCPEHIIRLATQNSGFDWLTIEPETETV